MTITQRIIVWFVMASAAIAGVAHPADKNTPYTASKVVMSYNSGSRQMELIGTNADGYQIWTCPNDSGTAYQKYARWSIDDGDKISQANRSIFFANKKWELNTEYNNGSDCYTSIDSTDFYFLKVKTQTTADLLVWDRKKRPSFGSEFQVTGTVTPIVNEQSMSNNKATHIVGLSYSGFKEFIFDYARIEYSYDKGATWQVAESNMDALSAASITHYCDYGQVRYRITVFPSDCYRVVLESDSIVTETGDYNLKFIPYQAKKVIMNTGAGSGTDISMSYIGITEEGYQIWACQGIDAHRYTTWKIDDGKKLSLSIGDFFSNTYYTLADDYYSTDYRDVPNGTQHLHVIKVKGESAADYFTWFGSSTFHPYSYYVNPTINLKTKSGCTVNDSNNGLRQELAYTIDEVNGLIIDHFVIETSYDSGKTWKEICRSADSPFEEATYHHENTLTADLTGEGETVRYRFSVYPKDFYKVLVKNGCLTYETEDQTITIDDVDFSLKANTIDHTAYNENEGKRTYTANITWDVLSKKADWLYSVIFKYSLDNGDTWNTVDGSFNASGTQDIRVPAGYTHYKICVEPSLKHDLSSIAAIHHTVVDEVTTTYAPAITSFAVDSCSSVIGCGHLRSVTCSYALNDDLWQTRHYAVISYSYDNGSTWMPTKQFVPDKTGSRTLTVDASHGQCQLRLEVMSLIDDNDTRLATDTQNITF